MTSRSICHAVFVGYQIEKVQRKLKQILHLNVYIFTFVPQNSYLFDRDNGVPCSQIIREHRVLDNGKV